LINSIIQYAQYVVGMSRRSQYVDADVAVLGWCMASVDDAALRPGDRCMVYTNWVYSVAWGLDLNIWYRVVINVMVCDGVA